MSDEGKSIRLGVCRREYLAEIRRVLEGAPEAAMWSEEALKGALNSTSDQFLVAWSGDELAGFVLGRMMGGEAEILNLAVKREFRRMGVGAALVREMLVRCESNGCARVFLEVRESNWGGIAFYDRLGFKQVGKREGYYREPDEAALVWARDT